MTETLQDMNASSQAVEPSTGEVGSPQPLEVEPAELEVSPSAAELDTARELVRSARARGVAMTGPDGILKALTKTVIETALDEEMADHLGYDKHQPEAGARETPARGFPRRAAEEVLGDTANLVRLRVRRVTCTVRLSQTGPLLRPRRSRTRPVTPCPAGSAPAFVPAPAKAVVRAASTNGIPSAALAAYQRAETVINAADKSCNMPLA
jgi:hypothetical protein